MDRVQIFDDYLALFKRAFRRLVAAGRRKHHDVISNRKGQRFSVGELLRIGNPNPNAHVIPAHPTTGRGAAGSEKAHRGWTR